MSRGIVEDLETKHGKLARRALSAVPKHAYSEEYRAEKCGIIKEGERAAVEGADKLHTAIVTFSGSNLNSREYDDRTPSDTGEGLETVTTAEGKQLALNDMFDSCPCVPATSEL